jgi:hypothetical protein
LAADASEDSHEATSRHLRRAAGVVILHGAARQGFDTNSL